MSGPSRELLLRRDKVKDARIAELEAENKRLRRYRGEVATLRLALQLICDSSKDRSTGLAVQALEDSRWVEREGGEK